MELNKIAILIEKYFQGDTTITEENILRDYFSGSDVNNQLEKYKPLFQFQIKERKVNFNQNINLKNKNQNVIWFSVAASFLFFVGLITFLSISDETIPKSNNLGSYQDPKHAFLQTQKALAMLSSNVNVGINSVQHLEEFEVAKNKVFKK